MDGLEEWLRGCGCTSGYALQRSKTIGPDGVYDGGVPAIGILIVEATNMEAAVAIAQAYPVSAFNDGDEWLIGLREASRLA